MDSPIPQSCMTVNEENSDLSLTTLIHELNKYNELPEVIGSMETDKILTVPGNTTPKHDKDLDVTSNDIRLKLECLAKNCSTSSCHYYLCAFCASNFSSETKLKKHIREFHKQDLYVLGENTSQKCPFCFAFFHQESAIFQHLLEAHQSSVLYPVIHKSFKNTTQYYQCLVCVKNFPMNTSMKKIFVHIQKHHSDELKVALKSLVNFLSPTKGKRVQFKTKDSFEPLSSTPLKNNNNWLNIPSETPIICVSALKHNRSYRSQQAPLRVKQDFHDDEPRKILKYRCMECKEYMHSNCSLLIHVKTKHRKPLCAFRPLYGCGLCPARFYTYRYLMKHMKSNSNHDV